MDTQDLEGEEALAASVEHLKKIQFIGPFPHGILVLLVPFNEAFREARSVEKDLTESQLKTIFKINNIHVFSTVEDYAKFRGLKK